MSTHQKNSLLAFQWEPQAEAQQFVDNLVNLFLQENCFAKHLSMLMNTETSTRFKDWIGYICLRTQEYGICDFEKFGFQKIQSNIKFNMYMNLKGVFPTILVGNFDSNEVVIKVESVADFLIAHKLNSKIIGEPQSLTRYALIFVENNFSISILEQHGVRTLPQFLTNIKDESALYKTRIHYLYQFRNRKRDFVDEDEGFEALSKMVNNAVDELGADLASDVFFTAEREHWMQRNRAAQVQKGRQDKIGLGWANHDHHTYRSSRVHFTQLVNIHEKLGLICRERFYSGREAGWGAQVMEQPTTGIITFNDVDLSAEELQTDFAHERLKPLNRLGTVGLWCALHGESILEAGMHHLEAQFDFEILRSHFEQKEQINVMKPFTDLDYLHQAFTEGETWAVKRHRIQKLLKANYITLEQAENFQKQGAIGSHLEILERNDGYKGFNKTGINEIIAATDPRTLFVPDQDANIPKTCFKENIRYQ